MRNLFLFLFLVVSLFSGCSYGDVGSGGRQIYVGWFIPDTQAVQSTVIQHVTGYNNACGPTSLLFLDNHFSRRRFGYSPSHLLNVTSVRVSLTSLYAFLGIANNSATNFDQLKRILVQRWGWTQVYRASANNSRDTNMDSMITRLRQNITSLIVFKKDYPGNPLYGLSPVDHIVIVYQYLYARSDGITSGDDLIFFFEPYYGLTGSFPRRDSASAVNLANFSFLSAAPWFCSRVVYSSGGNASTFL